MSSESEKEKGVWVYLIESSRGPYYTGWTVNPLERYQKHLKGKASKFTSSFVPKKLVALWKIPDGGRSQGQKLESFVRRLSRKEKELLVSEPGLLEELFQNSGKKDALFSIIAESPAPVEKEAKKRQAGAK